MDFMRNYHKRCGVITEEIINEFIELLNNCEFARFAPGDPSKKMDELYHKGIDVITKIEKKLK